MTAIIVTPDGPQLDLGDCLVPCTSGWLIDYRGEKVFVLAEQWERMLHPAAAEPGVIVLARRDDSAVQLRFDLARYVVTSVIEQDGSFLLSWVIE